MHNKTMRHYDLLHFCHGLELEILPNTHKKTNPHKETQIICGPNNKTANRLNLCQR